MLVALIPSAVLGGLGLCLAVFLLVASRRFYVYEDPRVVQVAEALPGSNCGACGSAGCHSFAEIYVTTKDTAMYCPPGGTDVAQAIATIMGLQVSTQDVPTAVVLCGGTCEKAKSDGLYEGLDDCRAAALLGGNEKLCSFGCMGLGSCVRACEYDALIINDQGLAVVLEDACVACEACVPACPVDLIEMIPRGPRIWVACKSEDPGKPVRAYCDVGCISCKKCVKACNDDAIGYDRDIAWVKYDNCTLCGDCVAACPTDSIIVQQLGPESMARAYPPKKEKPAKKKKDSKIEAPASAEAPA